MIRQVAKLANNAVSTKWTLMTEPKDAARNGQEQELTVMHIGTIEPGRPDTASVPIAGAYTFCKVRSLAKSQSTQMTSRPWAARRMVFRPNPHATSSAGASPNPAISLTNLSNVLEGASDLRIDGWYEACGPTSPTGKWSAFSELRCCNSSHPLAQPSPNVSSISDAAIILMPRLTRGRPVEKKPGHRDRAAHATHSGR